LIVRFRFARCMFLYSRPSASRGWRLQLCLHRQNRLSCRMYARPPLGGLPAVFQLFSALFCSLRRGRLLIAIRKCGRQDVGVRWMDIVAQLGLLHMRERERERVREEATWNRCSYLDLFFAPYCRSRPARPEIVRTSRIFPLSFYFLFLFIRFTLPPRNLCIFPSFFGIWIP